MRTVGHVTPTPTFRFEVACDRAPRTDQTNGLCPCSLIHGWKWSEIDTKSKPASSAATAISTSLLGECSSLESVSPCSTMSQPLPAGSVQENRAVRHVLTAYANG